MEFAVGIILGVAAGYSIDRYADTLKRLFQRSCEIVCDRAVEIYITAVLIGICLCLALLVQIIKWKFLGWYECH